MKIVYEPTVTVDAQGIHVSGLSYALARTLQADDKITLPAGGDADFVIAVEYREAVEQARKLLTTYESSLSGEKDLTPPQYPAYLLNLIQQSRMRHPGKEAYCGLFILRHLFNCLDTREVLRKNILSNGNSMLPLCMAVSTMLTPAHWQTYERDLADGDHGPEGMLLVRTIRAALSNARLT